MAAQPAQTIETSEENAEARGIGIAVTLFDRLDEIGRLSDEALIAQNDSTFKHHLDRYKYHTRYDSDPIEHRDACMDMLAVLEARLARHANLCRKDRSLTDMAIMPFIRQFAATDREWFAAQPLPYVHKWLACHETSDIFRAIMIKLEPWRVGDAPIEFSAP